MPAISPDHQLLEGPFRGRSTAVLGRLGPAAAAVAAVAIIMSSAAIAHAQSGFDDPWGDGDDLFDDDDDDDGYEQPPVTAGGLYTKETYPVAEIERPLTITEGVAEVRAELRADLSAEQAFEIFFGRLEGRYGLRDHIELQAAFEGLLSGEIAAGNKALMSVGLETAIVYDLVDVRATAEIPLSPERKLDFALGVPVRYRVTSELAIIAADRLLTIHTDDRKPDLTVGVGAFYQIVPELVATARAQYTLPQFDTDLDAIVPVTVALQFSPSHLVDLGIEAALANVALEDARFDQRFAVLFGRLRL